MFELVVLENEIWRLLWVAGNWKSAVDCCRCDEIVWFEMRI